MQGDHAAAAERLLQAGADPDAATTETSVTALMLAAEHGRADIVALLMGASANPNTFNNNGWTPLMFAAEKGHADIVQQLIASGAYVNATRDGETALKRALDTGNKEIERILRAAGAQ